MDILACIMEHFDIKDKLQNGPHEMTHVISREMFWIKMALMRGATC